MCAAFHPDDTLIASASLDHTVRIWDFAKLKEKYPDVEWLVVYVREAHPGEKAKQAETIDGKIED